MPYLTIILLHFKEKQIDLKILIVQKIVHSSQTEEDLFLFLINLKLK